MFSRAPVYFLLLFPIVLETKNYSGNHSLVIYVTFAPGHGYVPTYSSYGMLDDYKVFSYNSTSKVLSSPLRQHASLTSVWRNLELCTDFKTGYFNDFIGRANTTLRLNGPILQLIYGCQLSNEGAVTGLYHFGLNGKYTLSMAQDSILWDTYLPKAMEIKKILNSFESWNKNNLIYMQRDCVPRLKKFYMHSETIINRKVRPEVAIRSRSTGEGILICVASGFYPKGITVEWQLDGKPTSANVMSTDLLPNHDLTYQVQKILVLSALHHNYSCRVEHSSLLQPLVVYWEPIHENTTQISRHSGLIGVACFVVVVLTTIILYLIWKRLKNRSLT